ncbi:MAG: PilZ domain-containing protein [Nitrospirota bacterium]
MKKRQLERVPVDVPVSFFYDNALYIGNATNLSNNGMYIESEMCLPFQSKFEIYFSSNSKVNLLIPLKYEDIEVPVKVKRLIKTDGCYNGMGVELLNQSQDYLDFVESFRSEK